MQSDGYWISYLRELKISAALGIAGASLLCATSANAITLTCVGNGFEFPMVIDEARNEVIVMKVRARDVKFGENMIVFYLDLNNGTWPFLMSRLTGQLDAKSPLDGEWLPPYRCEVANPKF